MGGTCAGVNIATIDNKIGCIIATILEEIGMRTSVVIIVADVADIAIFDQEIRRCSGITTAKCIHIAQISHDAVNDRIIGAVANDRVIICTIAVAPVGGLARHVFPGAAAKCLV